MDNKSQITIKIRRETKDRWEKWLIDHMKRTGKRISLAEYLDQLKPPE